MTANTIPLFIAQTSVESQRSSGYRDTHSAVNEFVDNSIEAGANDVRVYYVPQREGRKIVSHDIVVFDNGRGMDPELLQKALAFGGGDRFERHGIGRFGYGLPNAAISQGKRLEVYTWQNPNETYKAVLDVERIKTGEIDGIEEPELDDVPDSLKRLLAKPIGTYPKGEEQEQHLLPIQSWPDHGTVVVVSDCDRLSYKQTRPFVEHSWELGRIYRHKIWNGVHIYVNNRLIEAVDPLFIHEQSRHFGAAAWGDEITINVPLYDPTLEEEEFVRNQIPTATVVARFSLLPEEWMKDDIKVNRNQRHIFHHHGLSVIRAEREMEMTLTKLVGLRETAADAWWGGEVHIPPALDEAFGISNNKQGIHPKSYVKEYLAKELRPAIARLRQISQQRRKEQREQRSGGQPTFTERRAAEAERLLTAPFEVPTSPEYQASVDASLMQFAKGHCRTGETPEMAFQRIKDSKYLLEFEHSPEGPFYRVDSFGPRVVVYLNTAHRFYDQVWEPLSGVSRSESDGGPGESDPAEDELNGNSPQSALAMLLLSLGRVELAFRSRSEEAEDFFRNMRSEWSTTLRTFLSNLM